MRIEATFIGSFPRPRSLMRAIGRFMGGKISRDELEYHYRRALSSTLAKLVRTGIASGTDCMFRWDDPLTPITQGLKGAKLNGLYRFFNNNFYYRVPIIEGRVELSKDLVSDWYERALRCAKELGVKYEVRPAIPGPLTLALLSEDRFYSSREELVKEYSRVMLKIVDNLRSLGARRVEVHEPALTWRKWKNITYAYEALEELGRSAGLEVWILTYFKYRNPKALLPLLEEELTVGLDLVENFDMLDRLENLLNDTKLVVGVVDSRNTRMEQMNDIKRIVRRLESLGIKEAYLTPNTHLEFLPEVVAYRKLRLLVRAAREGRSVR